MAPLSWPAYWQGIAAHAWYRDVAAAAPGPPTMLSPGEVHMLTWLTQHYPVWSARQALLDLGPFLGGSTVALATGLKARGGGARATPLQL
jgi:hypothetical protein